MCHPKQESVIFESAFYSEPFNYTSSIISRPWIRDSVLFSWPSFMYWVLLMLNLFLNADMKN